MLAGDEFLHEFCITEKIYRGFIEVFDDRNRLHTDEAYAQAHGFASKVMHGNILSGFLSQFVGELLPVKETIIHSIEIKFKKPCYLNEPLQFKAKLKEVYESVSVYIFDFSFQGAGVTKASGVLQIGVLA